MMSATRFVRPFPAVSLALILAGCASTPGMSAAPTDADAAVPAAFPIQPAAIPTGFPLECRPGEVEVMLLGTYHFGGSSGDAVQTPAEDILSDRRQAELDTLARRLAGWSPQQIFVEWPYTFSDSTTARYQRYVASGETQSRNEVVQLGFRLGRMLGMSTVHPIDHQMPIGNDSIGALLLRRPELSTRSDSLVAILRARADAMAGWRREASIMEHLRDANSEEALRGGNSLGMFGSFLAAGEGTNLGGPQLLARWYERNIIMVHNITRLTRPDTRRALVLVGSGHVPAMRNILHESPHHCPVSPLPLLR
jgi:hypothetical protein